MAKKKAARKITPKSWPKPGEKELKKKLGRWPGRPRPPKGSPEMEDALFAAYAYRDILLMVQTMLGKAGLTDVETGGGNAMPPN
jgi:hypothetical protein